jgi:hypothetical protein
MMNSHTMAQAALAVYGRKGSMQRLGIAILRRFLKDDRGQTAAVLAVVIFALVALSAAGVETGHVYYAYRLLQASTNAAALAAAQGMPDIGTSGSTTVGTAWGNLITYSSQSGEKNATNILQSDSITADFYCASSITGSPFNVGCQTPPSGEGSCTSGSTCNAVKATQTAKVSLWFGGFVGVRTMNLAAQATAAMRGGLHLPYNIAMIIDTTNSMTSGAPSADGCGTNASQVQCAVTGALDMLESMYPCVGGASTTCTSTSDYADAVSLFVFPPVAAGSATDDTNCPTKNPPTVPYAFPVVTPGSSQNLILPTSTTQYPNNAGTYQIVSWNQTYKSTNGSSTLLATDPLAVAVGAGGGTCQGLKAPGGQGTYYAQVIYAAQAALVAQQTAEAAKGYATSNVLIILSDGDATASNSSANTSAGGNNGNGNQIVALSGTLNGTCTSSKCTNSNATTTTYPSALGECGQAVQAAQAATEAGTKVYTVAMGSETSGSCLTDAQYTISSGSTYGAIGYPSGPYSGQACNAIEAMATNVNTFFSDNTGGCPASTPNTSYTTIGSIFQAVGTNLSTARLIPNGTT